MRATALVMAVAFVFASTTLLLGHVSGQESMHPDYCCQQPASDATLSGFILDQDGNPVAGATVTAFSSGPIYYAEGDAASEPTSSDGSTGSGSGSGNVSSGDTSSGTTSSGSGVMRPCCCCYGGSNSSVTGKDGHYSMGVWSGDLQANVYRDGYASASAQVHVEPGQAATQDFTLKAFPAKTAHVFGRITDAKTGQGLGFASISVRSPEYGLYECSWTDADRRSIEGDSGTGSAGGGSGSVGSGTAEPAKQDGTAIGAMPYYNPGCAFSVHGDGTFEGNVTPGYSILSVYAWQPCSTTRDADGSSSTSCGPEYLPWTKTLALPEKQSTRIDVKLPSRAAPDATVSGYLVDAESGQAIPGATISFSNQETYAYGSATTDQDGSYRIRLRSGYHSVSVYAPGHFPWEGVLQVPKGDSPFDVGLTPGQESYGGGCCYAALQAKGAAPMVGGSSGGSGTAMSAGSSGTGSAERTDSALGAGGSDSGGTTGEQYQDLGGGLGPYDAAARHDALVGTEPTEGKATSKGSPGAGLLLTAAALGAVALALRRRLQG